MIRIVIMIIMVRMVKMKSKPEGRDEFDEITV